LLAMVPTQLLFTHTVRAATITAHFKCIFDAWGCNLALSSFWRTA
jgi:hypothetical protein